MRRWLLRIVVVLGVLVVGAVAVAFFDVRRQLPDRSTPRIPGLGAPVEVRFDARGIPTVRARSLRDAIRVEGYLQARDRLFQMELARRAHAPAADAVFLSGTGLPTVGALERLEEELGKPVISGNQAAFWRALRLAGVRQAVPGFGRLLRET